MRNMNNLDFLYLVRELQSVKDSFLNQVYESEPGVFRFKFHGKRDVNMLVRLGQYAFLSTRIPESIPVSSFVRMLRVQLENSRMLSIEQKGFDRVLVITFQKKNQFHLIFELFGSGNMIFCNDQYQIIDAYSRETYAHRSLGPRKPYALPPNSKKAPETLTVRDLPASKWKVVSALAKTVNLSPFYLEEAAIRSHIDLDRPMDSLTEKEKSVLVRHVHQLIECALAPVVYYDGVHPVEFAPFALHKMKEGEPRSFSSFSEALEQYYFLAKPVTKPDPLLEKLKRTLAEQEKALTLLSHDEHEARIKADALFLNYDSISKQLQTARKRNAKTLSVSVSDDLTGP